jgi:hypothetical protein
MKCQSPPQLTLVRYSQSPPQLTPVGYSQSPPQLTLVRYSQSPPQLTLVRYSQSRPQLTRVGYSQSSPQLTLVRYSHSSPQLTLVRYSPLFNWRLLQTSYAAFHIQTLVTVNWDTEILLNIWNFLLPPSPPPQIKWLYLRNLLASDYAHWFVCVLRWKFCPRLWAIFETASLIRSVLRLWTFVLYLEVWNFRPQVQ